MSHLQVGSSFANGWKRPALPMSGNEFNAAHAFMRDEGPRFDPALFLQGMSLVQALFARTLASS